VIKKEIVTVDKPIAFVPKPPEVPKFVSEVDKLSPADAADPGKVGVAYKYDMLQLRKLLMVYEMIVEQYRQSSQNFDKINAEINALFNKINEAEAAKVKALTEPSR
jgi:hypothetical protein